MITFHLRWLNAAALCAVACAATAQTPAPTARRADPLEASASVPAMAYESALSHHRRAADDRALPWREANDTAARIGGWRAYAREAQQREPATPAAAAPSAASAQPTKPAAQAMPMPMPMPHGHGGHQKP